MAKLSINANTIVRQDGGPEEPALASGKKRRFDTAYELYVDFYQAITGLEGTPEALQRVAKEFLDLIVIDECHRGSAAEDSA